MAAGIVGVVLLGGGMAAPGALADVEPNSAIFTAETPIAGGQDVHGTVGPGDTDDWYAVHIEGAHQLHLTSPQLAPAPGDQLMPRCVSVELTNGNGSPLPADFTSDEGESTFYVHAFQPDFQTCPPSTAYSFRLDPAEALVTGPGKPPIKGTAEPNDKRSTAGGPLAPGAWYHSELETANDQDWLRLYVRPRRRVDVQAVVYGPQCSTHEVTLRDARGRELTSFSGTRETIGHLVNRSSRGTRLYVQIRAENPISFGEVGFCVHAATVIQVTPEEAVMSAADVRKGCRAAGAATRRNTRRVAAGKRALARALARGTATGQLRRKLRRDQRALRRSRGLVAAYCSR